MDQIQKVKSLCARYGIKSSKKLGQNFLTDGSVVRKMCAAADLTAEDYVVEVGPGFGILTEELAKRVRKVVAIEIDKNIFKAAKEILAPYKNVELVRGDVLKIPNFALRTDPQMSDRTFVGYDVEWSYRSYKVVASLPYSITSAVLRKFTEPALPLTPPPKGGEIDYRPSLMVILTQKEVADRVCAKPGAMSMLSVAAQYYGKPDIISVVPRSYFWPEPEVDSAILRIVITPSKSHPYLKEEKIVVDDKRLFQLVRIGFSSRRKQLKNNLAAGLRISQSEASAALENIGLDPKIRAQELAVEQWVWLAQRMGNML